MESFLRTFAKLTSNTEIPGLFAVWSGLAGLSCIMGRRCWIDMGVYTIFPNLFICLVASSGKCRKSTIINIVEGLLYQLEPKPNLISQKITPEALIEALKVVQTNDEHQFLKESCVGFVIADEFNTFLNKRTYETGLGTLLIPLFDCKSHFTYHTRGRGKEVLTDSCLGLLSGTTIDKLKEAIPTEAVGQGLTSRFIFVYCADVAAPVARTRRTKEQCQTEEELIKFLQKAMLLEGEITLTDKAWNFYVKNYNDFREKNPLYNMKTLEGYASRRHVHLLKIAFLFAVSRRLQIVIKEEDIESANELLTLSEKSMPMLLNIITASKTGMLLQEVYEFIRKSKGMSRTELLALMSHKISNKELVEIYETLVHSGRIKVAVKGNDLFFTLS